MDVGRKQLIYSILMAGFFSCLFLSCEKTVSPIVSSSTKMQIDLSKLGTNKLHTILANELFSRVIAKRKSCAQSMQTTTDSTTIDEVKIVVLDLTQWKTWKLFYEAITASGEPSLFNNVSSDSAADYADFVEQSFKGYGGKLFSFSGSHSIKVNGSTATTTLFLNPGLNYIFYAFRSNGKTIDYGDLSQVISETGDNIVKIGNSQSAIPVDGLVAFYPFDGNANDFSGNGMDLANAGATLTTGFDGKGDGAYYFSNQATMRFDNTVHILKNLYNPQGSVSLWVNVPSNFDAYATQGGSYIFNISGDWGTNEGISISISTANKVFEAQIHVNNTRYLFSDFPVTFNKFTHLVMTYDGNKYNFYVDDTLRSSLTITGKLTYSSTYRGLGVGWWNAVPGYEHYFTGTVDQIRVYNRALTENEVDALYHEKTTDNFPPGIPEVVSPTDNGTNISLSANLQWTCTDFENDPLTYDVYLDTTETPALIASNLTNSKLSLSGLVGQDKTYYWKIVAKDAYGNTNHSPLWRFKTASTVLISNGLVAYYPFNGNANDESGNGHNSAVVTATLSADRFGHNNSAYSFNGSDTYIQIPHAANLNFTTAFTIAAWIHLDNVTGPHVIVAKSPGNTSGYIFKQHNSNDRLRIELFEWGDVNGNVSLATGRWLFTTVTFNGTEISLFVDGVLDKTETMTGVISSNSDDLYIGAYSGISEVFEGSIDDVRIYNRALSEQEITKLYNEVK